MFNPFGPYNRFRWIKLTAVLVAILLVAGTLLTLQRHNQSRADFLFSGLTGGNPNVPTNARVDASWDAVQNKSLSLMSWDPTPGSVSYNVYAYNGLVARGLTGTSYQTQQIGTLAVSNGKTFSVTAVDASGRESLPSNIVNPVDTYSVASPPTWTDATLCPVPTELVVTPQWNSGAPRNLVVWRGNGCSSTYNVYRDGQKLASGMWGLNYIDTALASGSSHSYSIATVKTYWPTQPESAQSPSVTAVALSSVPTFMATKVNVTGVKRNDDSVSVFFDPVPGATDYRIYKQSNPNTPKYAGVRNIGTLGATPYPVTPYSIELNNVDVTNGNDVVVEAVDQLGPFQTMDGSAGPGMMWPDGMHVVSNGQGDPSNIPNVIARSDTLHLTAKARGMAGAQAFFDTFRGSKPLVDGNANIPAAMVTSEVGSIVQSENDKWIIRDYHADEINSKNFIMNNHFMDTTFDGPSPDNHPFSHNNNTSVVMQPKSSADISGGKVLHFTMESDAHMDGRRWVDVMFTQAGQPLMRADPSKLCSICSLTPVTNEIVWSIDASDFGLNQYSGHDPVTGNTVVHEMTDRAHGVGADSRTRNRWDGAPLANGTAQDLDKRHVFDIFLSQNRVQIYEEGTLYKDTALPVPLPYTSIDMYAVHEIYHTGNDRHELIDSSPSESYWSNYRPWSDERHWDNMGFEVLDSFAQAQPTVLAMEAPTFVTGALLKSACLSLQLANRGLGSQAVPSLDLQVRKGTSVVATLHGSLGADGRTVFPDTAPLNALSDTQAYTVWLKPMSYLAQALDVTGLSAQCHSFPVAFLAGDFSGANRLSIGDLVTLISAFNGKATPATQAAYPLNAPGIAEIVSWIRTFNTAPTGAV